MNKATRSTILHAVEVAVVGAVIITVVVVFQDFINSLLMKLANSPDVLDALQAIVVAVLVALASMVPKWLRASGSSVRDYVNE